MEWRDRPSIVSFSAVSQYQSVASWSWKKKRRRRWRNEEKKKPTTVYTRAINSAHESNIHNSKSKTEIKIHKLWEKHEFVMNSWQFFLLVSVARALGTSLTILVWLAPRCYVYFFLSHFEDEEFFSDFFTRFVALFLLAYFNLNLSNGVLCGWNWKTHTHTPQMRDM